MLSPIKKRAILAMGMTVLCWQPAQGDTRISVANANFRSKTKHQTEPDHWIVTKPEGTHVYQLTRPGVEVLAMFGTGASVEQAFLASEATADRFSTYYVTFDAGWRNNAKKDQIFSFTFEIVNLTKNKVLGQAVYVIPPNTPSNKFDEYREATTGTTLKISIENTMPGLMGDKVGLRITSRSTVSNFTLTGCLDNIYVRAAK